MLGGSWVKTSSGLITAGNSQITAIQWTGPYESGSPPLGPDGLAQLQLGSLTYKSGVISLYIGSVPTWSDYIDPWPKDNGFPAWLAVDTSNRQLILGMDMVAQSEVTDYPYNGSPSWMTNVTSGNYDTYYTEFATALLDNDMGKSVIRLCYEMNAQTITGGFTGSWTSGELGDWAAAWAYIANKMKATAPDLLFCWNPNCAVAAINFADYFPSGGSGVDIVAMDTYDTFGQSAPEGGWDTVGSAGRFDQLEGVGSPAQTYALSQLITLAQNNGLSVAIPEWGIYEPSVAPGNDPTSGGDDPQYVEGMAAMLDGVDVAFTCWFQAESSDASTIPLGDSRIPATTAAYVANFT